MTPPSDLRGDSGTAERGASAGWRERTATNHRNERNADRQHEISIQGMGAASLADWMRASQTLSRLWL